MKRNLLVLGLALLASPAVGGPVIRSAAEPDYPPLSQVNEHGEADGFSVELLRAAVAAMGREVSFETGLWDELRQRLADGELDVLPLVGRTPEREALYDFTVPYLTLHGALFVRDNETRIRGLDDLPGMRVAVMRGDNAEEYVRRAGLTDRIITTETFDEAFRLLSGGEADAVIAQKLMGVTLLRKMGIFNIKVTGAPNEEFKQAFCFAVHKGNVDLLQQLNAGLQEVTASGQYRQIQQEWLGDAESGESRRAFIRIVGIAIAAGLLILVLSGIIIASLRHEVQRRTADLEAANRELRESRSAVLNIMEDAIQAKERLEMTQFALDHAADEVFWIRPDGTFAYVNEAACLALGWSREELLRMGVGDVDPDFPMDDWPRHWQELKERKALVFETGHRTRDGRTYPVEVHATYLKFGEHEYNCSFAHNIANRREAEQKIQQQLKDLERWQSATSGRERRVLELKKEVNELLLKLNREPKYDSVR